MSKFKEWEQWLKAEQALKLAQIEAEHEEAVAKANLKRAQKRLKAMKKARPAMFIPDRPPKHEITVVLNVRPVVEGVVGELTEVSLTVGTISELQAQLQARRHFETLGFLYRGVVMTKRED